MDSSYSDGAGNTYFVSENSIQYSPMTPEMSSSGLYSGGEPAKVELSPEQHTELMALFDAAFADTENQVENRAKLTGFVQKGEDQVVLAQNAESKENLETALKGFLETNEKMGMEIPEGMEAAEVNAPSVLTVEGELLNTKGGPSVEGVHLPENGYDDYIGKNVRVTGEVVTVEGGNLVNEAGEYLSGFEGSRKIMETVDSIEVIE